MSSTMNCFINPRDFGAMGDGTNLDTTAVQAAFDAAHARGGATVYLSPGVYRCGTLHLRSRVSVHIGAGATLQASHDPEDFKFIKPRTWSRMDIRPYRMFLYAEDETEITLCGDGIIDGGGRSPAFMNNPKDNDSHRPYCIHMVNCTRITVRDLRLQNSAFWMQRYLQCDDIRVSGLRNFNHATFNNDGIDIDSSTNAVISDCIFDTSDDVICLKSEGRNMTRNVTVTNCILATHASAIKLGTGSIGGFENVVVSNCVIRPSQSKVNVHPLVVWNLEANGGIAGIDLAAVDGGVLRHCIFSNIIMEGLESAFSVRVGNRMSTDVETNYGTEGDVDGGSSIEHIIFENIDARGLGPYTSPITGYAGHPIKDILFRNVTLRNARPPKPEEQSKPYTRDLRGYPCSRSSGHIPSSGMMLHYVDGARLENVRVYPAAGDARPPFSCEHCSDVLINGSPA